ncbi:MAG: hypothetical protein IH612_07865 [Desulfofustis sp.]|nr:hypothetical protein [Desulfofustis sp.]
MKKGYGRGFLLAMVLLLLPSGAFTNPWEMKLPFAEATITYELSGMETGEEVLYIKDHGKRTAQYRTASTSMFGMTMKNRTVEITDPDWVYSFDLQEQTGTKSINPQKLMVEEFNKLSGEERKKVEQNAETMGTSMMQGMQGTVEPKVQDILGYPCDKVTMMGVTVYSIHGSSIPLLTDSNMMGIAMKSTATSISEGPVAEEHFQFPAGIDPQPDAEADRMAQIMAEQTIAMLKDPESFKKENKSLLRPRDQGDISPEDQQKMEEAMNALKGLFGK